MASAEPDTSSLAAKAATAAWILLVLSALLHVYDGLTSVAYVFMGISKAGSGIGGWTEVAMGLLQAIVALAVFVFAARGDLRGATLTVAGCIVLGWVSTLPSVAQRGLDFRTDAATSGYFVVSPVLALAAAALAWRNAHPVLAAFIVTAPTFAGLLFVIAFGIVIAIHGF